MKHSTRMPMLVAAAVLAFAAAGALRRPWEAYEPARGTMRAAPSTAFVTVVLGGFRGLIADALWLRASYLQDEGRYFELVHLSEWIADLDPHSAETWTFHAWNMAYNVCAMMVDPEDRWRWVDNGIRLLRNRAPHASPAEATLFTELAWIYQNKIGDVFDPAHAYFKRRVAHEVDPLLPGGRVDPPQLTPELCRRLGEQLRMECGHILHVAEAYGPLDWRVAETHAVYWASLGASMAREPFVALRADRIVYQSMAMSVYKGQWDEDHPDQSRPSHRPRPDLFPFAEAAFNAAMERHPEDPNIPVAHRGFLASVVFLADAFGAPDVARAAFDELARRYPSPMTDAGFEMFRDDKAARAAVHPLVHVSIVKLTQGWDGER